MAQPLAPGNDADAAASTSTSALHRSNNVVYHGDLVEFLDYYRCESCVTGQRKCIIQQQERSCMLCSDAGRPCLFTRTVQLKGHADEFSWDTLLSDRSELRDARTFRPTSDIQSSGSGPGQNGYEHIHRSVLPNSLPLSSNAGQGISPKPDNATTNFPTEALPYPYEILPKDSQRRPAIPSIYFYPRKLPDMEDERPARSGGLFAQSPTIVCPILPQALRSDNEYQNLTESGQESHTVSPRKLDFGALTTSRSANKRPFVHMEDSLSTSSEAGAVATQRNELQSGLEADDEPKIPQSLLRTTYVCIDISNDQDFLKGCKQCESGKEYHEDYNAGEHLRRMHFNKRSKDRRGKDPSDRRGGKAPGADPPMSELRKWMKKIESRIETPVALDMSMTLQNPSERASSRMSTTSNSDLMELSNSWRNCPKCDRVFHGSDADRKHNIKRHIAEIHEIQRLIPCNRCSAQFRSHWNLKRHVEKHHDGLSKQQESPTVQGEQAGESDILMNTVD